MGKKKTKNSNLNEEESSEYDINHDPSTTVRSKKQTRKSNRSKINLNEDEIHNSLSSSNLNPMLAEKYDGSQNIDNWFVSEKLDGIRAIWNGSNLRSRNGNIFHPPKYFIETFPKDLFLDGELFLERGKFSETVSIVKKQYSHDGWDKIKFLVFDAPGLKAQFKDRLCIIEASLGEANKKYIELHHHEVLKDKEELDKRLREVISKKGEGLIVRDPDSFYENRRSKSMLKVKEFHDAEATVLAHLKGTGRLCNTIGSLLVVNDDGVEFKIGSGFTDKERRNMPKIGSRVTYRYFELSKDKVPRFPTFLRVHPGM